MQRNRILSDLLSTLFARGTAFKRADDDRTIFQLCEALLSAEGEVSGQTLASVILARYRDLNDEGKRAFFGYLNDSMDIDGHALAVLSTDYANNPTVELFRALSRAAEPRRQELFRRLNQPVGATAELVAMRVDLLHLMRDMPELARTDTDFVHLLRSWFNRGFLVLQNIDWDTPARVLDKIVAYEAVHQINDFDDLRRRLYPSDRKCFAYFHPAMPDEPLIFVEVALTKKIPSSIQALLSEEREPLAAEEARVAAFYSISNCQKGLSGISFGNLLIKQVAAELAADYPQLTDFVTLSPIPGLNAWLAEQKDDPVIAHAARRVLDGAAPESELRGLAARYLLKAKRSDGKPRDPVARFHLGNGAVVHDVHAGADTSANGLRQSGGAMVNYRYDLARTEANHEAFELHGTVAVSRSVQSLAALGRANNNEEPAA